MLKRLVSLFTAFVFAGQAAAQTLPSVPPVPDADRSVVYSVSSPTQIFGVPFAIYGDCSDVQVKVGAIVQPPTGYTCSSASGRALASIPRPVTDLQITLAAPAVSGSVSISGAYRPRNLVVPTAPGISRREFEQAINTITSGMRELKQNLPPQFYGAWNPAIAYPPGAVVTYQAISYQASQASTGQAPSANSLYWSVIQGGCNVAVFGLLKGNGTGPCTAAVPGPDYLTSSIAPLISNNLGEFTSSAPTARSSLRITTVYLTDFVGADPTGSLSVVAAFQAACQKLNAAPGNSARLIVPDGTYKVDATIDCSTGAAAQAKDWQVSFEGGAKLVATSALSTSALKIFDATQAQTYTLDIDRAHIDMSQATCGPACQGTEGTTAIEVQGQRRVTLQAPSCTGGTSYNNNNANSCGTPTKVGAFQVIGGDATGFVNSAFYVVGDLVANGPKGYTASITNFNCSHVITCVEAKFSLDSVSFTNSKCDYCHIGFGTFNAGTNSAEPSARFAVVKGNIFRHTQGNAVQINGQTLADVEGNIGIDMGYDETNTLTNPGVAFYQFNGAAGSTFSNNSCRMLDWVNSSFICAQTSNVTFNGVVYSGGGLVGSGNSIQGITYALYEGPGVLPSLLTATWINNVPNIDGGTPGPGTTVEYLNNVDGTRSIAVRNIVKQKFDSSGNVSFPSLPAGCNMLPAGTLYNNGGAPGLC